MTQEILKLALKELLIYQERVEGEWGKCRSNEEIEADGDTNLVITAIKEVLSEHAMREVQRLGQEIEQEPVMWVSEDVCEGQLINGRPRKIWWECDKGVGTAFYTTPPQRTWVGLTEEEILAEIPITTYRPVTSFARAIEAKLKEKNNAA